MESFQSISGKNRLSTTACMPCTDAPICGVQTLVNFDQSAGKSTQSEAGISSHSVEALEFAWVVSFLSSMLF
jgi:hypothetical protein